MSHTKRIAPVTPIAVAVVVVVAVVAAAGCGGNSAPAGSTGAAEGALPENVRTVVVWRGSDPAPSQPGEPVHTMLLEGSVPSRSMAGTVMTDENCEPDADGVSHCTNAIRLASGHSLVVRHSHRMVEVPCLAPGENVVVRGA
jgi:hypothetical protein